MSAESLLRSRTAALIGASGGENDPQSFNARLTRSVLAGRFDAVYLVNPSAHDIAGRAVYPSIASVPTQVDLAVIAVPAGSIRQVVDECISASVPNCWAIAAGISARDRLYLRSAANRGVLTFAGGNCIGYVNNLQGTRAYAGATIPSEVAGDVALITQSGGIAGGIISMANNNGIDFSHIVTTGDELALSSEDFLEVVLKYGETRAVVMVIEQLRQPLKFRRLARLAAMQRVPIVLFKVGKTSIGSRAAFAHTGALVGDWDEAAAAMEADGVVLCDSIEQILDVCSIATSRNLSKRMFSIAVVTSSGAMGAVAGDLIAQNRLQLAELTPPTRAILAPFLSATKPILNPLDTSLGGGTMKVLPRFMAAVPQDPAVDLVVFIYSGTTYADSIVDCLLSARREAQFTCMTCWPGQPDQIALSLRDAGIRSFNDAARLFQAVAKLNRWQHRLSAIDQPGLPDYPSARKSSRLLNYSDSRRLLRKWNVPSPLFGEARSIDRLRSVLNEGYLTWPVVMKVADGKLHKASHGGVVLGIDSVNRAVDAFKSMGQPHVLVEDQIDGGLEILVDVRRSMFGDLLTIGWGGVFANALRDTVTVAAPVSRSAISLALAETKVGAALKMTKSRGRHEWQSVLILAGLMLKVLRSEPEVDEIELNPVIVTTNGCVAVDVRVVGSDCLVGGSTDSG